MVYYVSDETISTVSLHESASALSAKFSDNSEWKLVSVRSSTETTYTTNYISIHLEIERRALFTTCTMIIPLITLSVINAFTFLVPVESGEKASLAITMFLAYGFFVTITRDVLPHNSMQVSYYVIYMCVLLIISVLTLIYVIIESKVHATIGNDGFKLRCGRSAKVGPLKSVGNDDEAPDVPDDTQSVHDINTYMTWTELLSKIDILMFILCLVFLVIFNACLCAKVICRK